MSELTIVTGGATDVSGYSHTSGHVSTTSGNVGGSVSTTHTTCLRVGNVAVRFRGTPNVPPGDEVRVVGYRRAELAALALRNNTTNLIYFGDGAFASAAPGSAVQVTALAIRGFVFPVIAASVVLARCRGERSKNTIGPTGRGGL